VMLDSEPDEGAWLQVRCGNTDFENPVTVLFSSDAYCFVVHLVSLFVDCCP